jgi:hypothetical protein
MQKKFSQKTQMTAKKREKMSNHTLNKIFFHSQPFFQETLAMNETQKKKALMFFFSFSFILA